MSTPQEMNQAALGAVSAALEEIAFFSVDPETPPSATSEVVGWAAVGGEHLPFSRIVISMPLGLARRLASTALGMDESEVSDGQALDALSEAVNIAGGEIARRLHCPDFHLLLPESGKGTPPVKTSVLTEVTVNVEGLPLGVRLETR